jgi:tetratricopeptide repeat protein
MKLKDLLAQSTVDTPIVRCWEEDVLLPTYETGEFEKNPIFLEKRVYQGSSGVVYPYPVIEKIADQPTQKSWHVVFIENQYIKVMIMPELGGRIQMAFDKVKQRHFVYFNQVIKPALVGLTGPWISGGIEFNWPQHHRPSTYLPTDFRLEEHADGSCTVWVNEVERMFRTKGMAGFTLYPDKAYIEIKAQLYNRTPFPQTFLWWANPAVAVNDDYQSVFPPDVNAVFDHGKRDVSSFPIATGVYYKMDYSAGVDISRYKNIPVPTSYMAIKSKYDFVGGYENDSQGGLLHVANHHVSPGKKQWTWGNGEFGKAWDRNLTEEDGPYIELMTGMYCDNQPDFTWLQPYEEKSFTQYFMPYQGVGVVKNATKDALINLEIQDQEVLIKVYTTGSFPHAVLTLQQNGQTRLCEHFDISPLAVKEFRLTLPGQIKAEELKLSLCSAEGRELVGYQADKPEIKPIPDPAKAAQEPKDIASMEQLYLTGLHLEQYRHATYNPADYYLEGLKREPGDVRCNNAMGLLLMRKGQFAKAEPYFRQAIATLTERNPNPYDGEPLYNLGWSLKMQGRYEEAYEQFFKACWNAAWQDAGYFNIAQIDLMQQHPETALENIERSLIRNWHNHKARALKAAILRKLNRTTEALAWIEDSLAIDAFNMGCRYEKYLLTQQETDLDELKTLMRNWNHGYIEYSLDYAEAGMWEEATSFLQLHEQEGGDIYPMVYYALGYYTRQAGQTEKAKAYYSKASQANPAYCFPNRIEEVVILESALAANPADAKASYYLGNFWYGARQYEEAVKCWETSVQHDDSFPTVWRNLALAYYNKLGQTERALQVMEKAFALDQEDARVFMELDQLYKKLGVSHTQRLEKLKRHMSLTEKRDDVYLEYITLNNMLGNHLEAQQDLAQRKFHPWEGGEGKVPGQYLLAQTELAKSAIKAGKYQEAIDLLAATTEYPHNLGEGKLPGAQENDIDYYRGIAYQALGNQEKSEFYFRKASEGLSEPAPAIYYNDQQPDKIFYQGLAWEALGNPENARKRFNKLISYGEKHLFDQVKIDYFAVSLPDLLIWEDDLQKRNTIHCYYLMALGYLGLKKYDEAKTYFDKVLKMDINHQGAHIHRKMCE